MDIRAPKRILLLKHGETEENARGIHQGRGIGGTLSDQGARDVHASAAALAEAGLEPELILHSPMSRCRQSTDLVSARFPRAAVRESVRLAAKDSGHLSGLPRRAAADEAAAVGIPIHRLRAPGGESSEDVQARYVDLLREVGEAPSSTTLLLGHGGGYACLLLWLMGHGWDRYLEHVPASGALSLIEVDADGPRLTLINVPPAELPGVLAARTAS
ncbi:histidine phosphatase family protein [Streptomyces sp. RK75]|uniref:histidine phosphatase family protein n=1 Tax=Streptomyces sp. RK75 TaxID=2824895 RepID=UPI001B358553|nr:histidine phosphatase family protein [Streptomyces sp. RK75]MBQ0866363.1 histidine phosphatase family protein [Streptomyces sp. RK75]